MSDFQIKANQSLNKEIQEQRAPLSFRSDKNLPNVDDSMSQAKQVKKPVLVIHHNLEEQSDGSSDSEESKKVPKRIKSDKSLNKSDPSVSDHSGKASDQSQESKSEEQG